MNHNNVVQSEKSNKKHSKQAIFVFIAIVGLIIFTIAFRADFDASGQRQQLREPSVRVGDENQFVGFLMGLQRDADSRRVPAPQPVAPPVYVPAPAEDNVIRAQVVTRQRRRREAPQRFYSDPRSAQAAAMMHEMKVQAIFSTPEVSGFANQGAGVTQAAQTPPQDMTSAPLDLGSLIASFGGGGGTGWDAPSHVQRQENFLRGATGGGSLTPQGYSPHIPIPQQFRWELKAGTVIPAILMSGIDSSLPGMVRAQVSENVWDSTFGTHVLIPKGSMIIGVYDSDVAFGQRRVMMVWNRIIFPNGTTLNISGSPGADQGGFSGLAGRVDEHWGQIFRAALLSSLFVTGAHLLYDDEPAHVAGGRRSPRSIAAETVATEMLRVGGRLVDRAMSIPPVIRIRAGARLTVFVQEDIVFPSPFPMSF